MKELYPNITPYSFAINNPNKFKDEDGGIVRDENGNIIYTVDDPNSEYNQYQGVENDQLMTLYFKAEKGRVLTDKGSEMVVYKATSADVYLRVQEPVRDINGNLTYDANGNVVLQTISDQVYPGNFECSYNCTGNALTEQSFTISSDQITPEYRQEEGLKDIPLNKAQKGDVGLYIDNQTGTVTHLEPFLTNNTVSTKGGIAADQGPVQPGQSADFSKGATYQVVTKVQPNTEVVPSGFIGRIKSNQVNGDIQNKSTKNSINRVSNQVFNQIKNDVQNSQNP